MDETLAVGLFGLFGVIFGDLRSAKKRKGMKEKEKNREKIGNSLKARREGFN